MRGFFMVLALAFAPGIAAIVQADIGETEAELTAHFGPVDARRPERIQLHGNIFVLGDRIVFKQAESRITAVLIDGICSKITYAKTGRWTEAQFHDLLSRNANRWAWSEIPSRAPKWQRAWRREDGLVAKWRYVGGFAIEAQPFVDARRRALQIALRGSDTTVSRQ